MLGAVGACARAPVVTAPMVLASDASVADAGAAARAAVVSNDDDALHRGERFTGQYWCAQGRTDMTLIVDDVDGPDVDVIFDFHHRETGVAGSYHMRGSYDRRTRTLRLHGDRWISQPEGYIMIDLFGTMTRARSISGIVSGAPRCTNFSVAPEDSAAEPRSGRPLFETSP